MRLNGGTLAPWGSISLPLFELTGLRAEWLADGCALLFPYFIYAITASPRSELCRSFY